MGSRGGYHVILGEGTMGAPWIGTLSLLGLNGPVGPLDPWASLDPKASWHPREPSGQEAWGSYPGGTHVTPLGSHG